MAGKVTVLLVALAVLVSGCASGGVGTQTPVPTPNTVAIAALKGPTSMGLAPMMTPGGKWTDLENETVVELQLFASADQVTPKLAGEGALKYACLPINLAAVLYSKGVNIQLVAVNTLGALHVVTKGVSLNSFADLAGKTVYSTGKGTTPEYVFNYLLTKHGLTGKVNVEFLSEASEVATRLASHESAIGVLPEPYLTTVLEKDSNIKASFDFNQEWLTFNPDSPMVTAALFINNPQPNDAASLESFVKAYTESTDFTNADPAHASIAITALGIVPNESVAEHAIPRSNLTMLTGSQAKEAVNAYLQVLYDANPASVGGSLPNDDFFYAN
ncbi:MAG: hypothetical protein FWG47_08065 [Propionibacteriaceae bacterium]|nr:hypothetical protein [Propionibacteriaceae bacterium]